MSRAEQVTIDDDSDPDTYAVEAIRAKRWNEEAKTFEYQIKWIGYPESQNTWEPPEHLNCPQIVEEFEKGEREKVHQRRRRKADRLSSRGLVGGRLRGCDNDGDTSSSRSTIITNPRDIFLEDEDDDDDDASSLVHENKQPAEPVQPRGFERGLPLEQIVGATVGDDKKLFFVCKWAGVDGLDMVEAEEMEAKAATELCKWYRSRLYYRIEMN